MILYGSDAEPQAKLDDGTVLALDPPAEDEATEEQIAAKITALKAKIAEAKKSPHRAREVAGMEDDVKLYEDDLKKLKASTKKAKDAEFKEGVLRLSKLFAHDKMPLNKSNRHYSVDGFLHVDHNNISKGNICPYWGREIPGAAEMGLDFNRKYMLLRDPEELKKAADSFNNVPLLIKHMAVDADDHQPDLVIGSTGTDAKYNHPYLSNSLVVWSKEAIDAIESEEQKELSCGYRYRADMTPGTFEGEHYDGVMRDIIANHVALVEEGRAGPDVVVGDSKISGKEIIMPKTVLSRKAAMTGGALLVYLKPKLAADAKIDLTPILSGVTSDNFKDKKAGIASAITAQAKLAKDASLADIMSMLDQCESEEVGEDMQPNAGIPASETETGVDEMADPKDFLKNKLSAEDMKSYDEMCAKKEAEDKKAADEKEEEEKKAAADAAAEEEKKKAEDEAEAAKKNAEGEDKAMDAKFKVTMDAALKDQRDAIMKQTRDAAEAREFASQWVGKLPIALDSAEEIYRTALDGLGVKNHKDIHPSALKAVLEAQPKPGARSVVIANDAATGNSEGFSSRFANADRITVIG